MDLFSGMTPFSEFLVRNCMQEAPVRSGLFNPSDMKVHFFPIREEDLPADKLSQLNDCGETDRLAITR